MNNKTSHRVSSFVATAMLMGFSAADHAQASPTHSTEIAAQPLNAALRTFAKQMGLQLIYVSDIASGQKSRTIPAGLTSKEALNRLLEGTGLAFEFINDRTVRIYQQAESRPASTGSTSSAGSGTLRLAQLSTEGDSRVSSRGNGNETLQEVVVTGTHIRGVEETAAPSLTITRTDIDRSGYQTMGQLVGSLPQNFNGLTMGGALVTGSSQLAGQNSDHAAAIDLRGLGPQSTLTLVDGQRVAGAVQGRAVDVSMIPLSMVDHVDVVTGGASSIYGADAVGGVANVVLRHAYDGADTSASYSGTAYGGDKLQFSQVLGHDFGEGGVLLGYDFSRGATFDAVRAHLTFPESIGGAQEVQLPLEPRERKQSVYLSGRLGVTDGLELFANASYAHKTQDERTVTAYPIYDLVQDISLSQTNEEYGGTAGARIQLGSSWKLEVTGNSSAYTTEFYNDYGSGSQSSHRRSTLFSGSAVADGDFISFLGVQTKAAVGVDVRRETLSTVTTPAFYLDDPHAGRTVQAIFGEVHIPLVEQGSLRALRRLEVTMSARDDHYSDFGNAFDPQLGIIWQPTDDLSVRGAYAKAFRAPDLYTLHQQTSVVLSGWSVVTPENPTPTMFPSLQIGNGNPNLTAERARSWSLGLDYQLPFQPASKISLSYFDITYDDRIESPFASVVSINSADFPDSVLNLHPTAAQAKALYDLGTYNSGNYSGYPWDGNPATILNQIPNLILLDDRYTNLSHEKLRGVDFSADAHWSTALGEVSAGINATKTLTHSQQLTAEVSPLRIFNLIGAAAGFRARANVGLTHGPFGGYVFVNHTGAYDNPYTNPYSTIASWTTVDLNLQFDSTTIAPTGPLSHIAVVASAQNLLDRGPPLDAYNYIGLTFDASNSNGFGRILALSVRKKW